MKNTNHTTELEKELQGLTEEELTTLAEIEASELQAEEIQTKEKEGEKV